MKVHVDDILSFDDEAWIIELFGVRYSLDMFRSLGVGPVGATFKVVAREDGILTLQTVAPSNQEENAA